MHKAEATAAMLEKLASDMEAYANTLADDVWVSSPNSIYNKTTKTATDEYGSLDARPQGASSDNFVSWLLG